MRLFYSSSVYYQLLVSDTEYTDHRDSRTRSFPQPTISTSVQANSGNKNDGYFEVNTMLFTRSLQIFVRCQ